MVIGYTISASDIDAYFFEAAPKGVLCPKCKTRLDYTYVPENLNVPLVQEYDVVATYDSVKLFSKKFMDFVQDFVNPAPLFYQISKKPAYYYFLPQIEVPFDPIKRAVVYDCRCELCGGYRSIAGATPAPLKVNALPGTGFFRTDMVFGGPYKSPLIIVDPELKKALEKQDFRGLYFKEVYSADSLWPPQKNRN